LPRVIFVQPDGSRESHLAPVGDSVMDCAVDNGVAGIAAQCGGGCTCSTCHCYVPAPWFGRVGAPVGDEKDILEYVPEYQANSRLSCQIALTEDLDGIVVEIPTPAAAAASR
jgi:2Fe-2S ferredoxin